MVLKVVLLLLVLTVSQVIATSILQLRSLGSLEILEARQGTDGCTICTTVANIAGNCTTVACVCNNDVAGMVQDCVNCALAGDPSPTTVSAAQNLIDVYGRTCAGVAGIPAITRPPGVPAPSSSVGGLSPNVSSTRTPTTTSSRSTVTVTTVGALTPTVQSTVSGPTASDTGGPLPPVVGQSGAEKGKQTGYAVIGALLGAALLL